MAKSISSRNTRIYIFSEFARSLYFTVPMYIAFMQDRLSITEISLLTGFQFFTQLILELPTGALADILGKRLTIVISYLFDTLYFAGFILSHSFWGFLFTYAMGGIGESLRSGSSEAILYDSLKQDGEEANFAKVNAKQGTIFQIGLITATILGGFLYQLNEYLPMVLTGLAQFIAGIISFFYHEPSVDSERFTLSNYLLQIKHGTKEAFKTRSHRLISGYYILVGSISWLVMTYYVDFLLIDLGFDSQLRGLISAGSRIFNILLINKFLTRLNRTQTLILFPFLLVTFLTPGYLLSGWWGVPFVTGAMLSSTARWILLSKYTNEVFSSKYRATAISTLSMAIGLIYVVFTSISGPIMENFGGSRTIFTLLGLISLVTIPPLTYKLIKNN